MKPIFIIGNWKSHKTIQETREWFLEISNLKSQISNLENKTIILCPPFHLLQLCSNLIKEHNLPIVLGAQDVSPFDMGAYTGEVAAKQLAELVKYVIIGHSERRQNFSETDDMIAKKAAQARQAGLTPIVCVQGKETPIPEGVSMIAYEPVFAIGTGHPDTPEDAEDVLSFFKGNGVTTTIYGGSVEGENVASFTNKPSVDGVLPGTASLTPAAFASIITHA